MNCFSQDRRPDPARSSVQSSVAHHCTGILSVKFNALKAIVVVLPAALGVANLTGLAQGSATEPVAARA